jgi:hypothetical protein
MTKTPKTTRTIRITAEVEAWLKATYGSITAGVHALAVEAMRRQQ